MKVDVAMLSLPQGIKAVRKATDKLKALTRRIDRLENETQKTLSRLIQESKDSQKDRDS